MEQSNRVLVLGLGVSGEAAADLLLDKGASVTIVDAASGTCTSSAVEALQVRGAGVLFDVTDLPGGPFDLCVVSPGIDQNSAWVTCIESRGVEVVSELELGFRYCNSPIIAVTGTNGKSTLVKLLHEILVSSGLRSAIAGNYGIPLSRVVAQRERLDWIVVEVSSFQLEKVVTFHPRVGVLLNVQPDHLDRHGDLDSYRALKTRVFARMRSGDVGIVQESEVSAIQNLTSGGNAWTSFGLSKDSDVYYDSGHICWPKRAKLACIDIRDTGFDNPILGQAVAAAVAVAQACAIPLSSVAEVLRSFGGLSHRMQRIRTINGVTFIDDSKATNLAALSAALEMVNTPVRLIAGGRLKEKDLEFVKEVLATNVACVYVIGDAAGKLSSAWHKVVPCVGCGDLRTAALKAWQDADFGETVILSPGCASFDQFRSYEDRGDQFQEIVNNINEEN
jgi:UDP-N-acetylmuramoylalanine--D-glutamate ligase